MSKTWRSLCTLMLLILPWGLMFGQRSAHAQIETGTVGDADHAIAKQPRIAASLQQALATSLATDRLRVIVLMRAQTDLNRFTVSEEQSRASFLAARQQMHNLLRQTASESQLEMLKALQTAQQLAQADQVRSFWLINAVALRAAPSVIQALAQRTDVASIQVDTYRQWLLDTPVSSLTETLRTRIQANSVITPTRVFAEALFEAQSVQATKPSPDNLYGIKKIRADETWRELGLTGEGVVVANLDSGVDWQHPMLRPRYRGLGAGGAVDHLHSWFDATNEGSTVPYDLNGHGTHTMGTIVGQDGIGVAPGAKWIAAKILNQEGSGLLSWVIGGMQWMYAPGGDTAFAPDVINNSWGGTEGEPIFESLLEPMRAAGILNVWANGNSGPDAKSVAWPAWLPGSFSVGASDSDDEIAYFSSRGPGPGGVLKPVISAPGVRVQSTFPGSTYARLSGTSMATPHVTGAVALVLQAKPSLSIAATIYALTSTAKSLSTTLPNNESGYGRIDVYAAALSVISTGVITGQVLEGGQPISGALVSAFATGRVMETLSDANGRYSFRAPYGVYTATAGAFGFSSASLGPRVVLTNSVVAFNFNLPELSAGVLRGRVRDVVSGAVVTATVSALGTPKLSISDNSCPPCRYSLDLPAGDYTIEARALGYLVQTRTVALAANVLMDMDFELTPTQRIALVDTGAFYYGSQTDYYRAVLNQLHLAYDEYRVKHVPADVPTLEQLLKYDTVIWSAPRDSPHSLGAGETISSYLEAGGNLLLSGMNIAYFDGGGSGYGPYFSKLNANLRSLGMPSRVISGTYGPLANKIITTTGGDGANNQVQADTVSVRNPDYGALMGGYTDDPDTLPGTGGAGIYTALCTPYHAAYFNFGLEAIDNFNQRLAVISETLSSFGVARLTTGLEVLARDAYFTDVAIGMPGSVVTHALRIRNIGEAGKAETFSIQLRGQQWPTQIARSSIILEPCSSATLVLTTTIPITAAQDTRDIISVDVSSPNAAASLTFTNKTPATILVVDDDRFYEVESAYLDALRASSNHSMDRWSNRLGVYLQSTPPITVLRQYPIVVWFNGYDWYDPITTDEQETLRHYLDGGGRLFFSSQAALQYTQANSFDQRYLGVASVDYNDVITHVIGLPGNVIGQGFATATTEPFPYYWNLSTAIQPMPGSTVALLGDSGQPAALTRSGIMNGTLWRTVFMPFAFEALNSAARNDLMNRTIGTLSWLGTSSLSAEDTASKPGDLVTYTLRLRADSSMGATNTHTVAMSVPLSSGLLLVSSTLPNSSVNNAGIWRGNVHPNDSIAWTFVAQVANGLAAGTPLTANLQVAIEDIRLHFTRDEVIHVGQPHLQSILSFVPKNPRWNSIISATLVTQNIGDVNAMQVSITNVVPTGLTLLTDTIQLQGTGVITRDHIANVLTWQGELGAGNAITITYGISMPMLGIGLPDAFFHAASVQPSWTDGAANAELAAVWITPPTWRVSLPIVMRR